MDLSTFFDSQEVLVVRRKQELDHVGTKAPNYPLGRGRCCRVAYKHAPTQPRAHETVVIVIQRNRPQRQVREGIAANTAAPLGRPEAHGAVQTGAEEEVVVGREAQRRDGGGVPDEECLRLRRTTEHDMFVDGGGVFGMRVVLQKMNARVVGGDGDLRVRHRRVMHNTTRVPHGAADNMTLAGGRREGQGGAGDEVTQMEGENGVLQRECVDERLDLLVVTGKQRWHLVNGILRLERCRCASRDLA